MLRAASLLLAGSVLGLPTVAPGPVAGQGGTFDLGPYLRVDEGQSWFYAAGTGTASRAEDGTVAVLIGESFSFEREGPAGGEWLRRDESDGSFRWDRWDPERGLLVRSVHLVGNVEIRYGEPLLLAPDSLAPGATHEAIATYVRLESGVPVAEGTQTVLVRGLRREPVAVPAGRFEDALAFTSTVRRMDAGGAVEAYELEEWYAAGVGLVKLRGRVWRAPSEEAAPEWQEPVDLELVEWMPPAVVGGEGRDSG